MSDVERVAAIRQRLSAATEGEWSEADEHGEVDWAEPAWCVSRMDGEKYLYDIAYTTGTNEQADAEFIAHSRSDVEWLLAGHEKLQAKLAAAEARIEAVRRLHHPMRWQGREFCDECVRHTSPMPEPVTWPCPTIAALAVSGQEQT